MISLSPGMRFLSQDCGEDHAPEPVDVNVVCATDTNVNAYMKNTVRPNFMQYLYQLKKALFNRMIGDRLMGDWKGQCTIDSHLMVKQEYELGRLSQG
jgi:hypothetical protein